jgi:hypothetical protein
MTTPSYLSNVNLRASDGLGGSTVFGKLAADENNHLKISSVNSIYIDSDYIHLKNFGTMQDVLDQAIGEAVMQSSANMDQAATDCNDFTTAQVAALHTTVTAETTAAIAVVNTALSATIAELDTRHTSDIDNGRVEAVDTAATFTTAQIAAAVATLNATIATTDTANKVWTQGRVDAADTDYNNLINDLRTETQLAATTQKSVIDGEVAAAVTSANAYADSVLSAYTASDGAALAAAVDRIAALEALVASMNAP